MISFDWALRFIKLETKIQIYFKIKFNIPSVAALNALCLSIWLSYVSVAFVNMATRKTIRRSAEMKVRRAEGVRLILLLNVVV
jgi:hypothetical protein